MTAEKSEIGLLAVDHGSRGKGIGTALIQAAINHTKDIGSRTLYVSTQSSNLAACHLYEKSDFLIDKVTYVYHFWL